MKDKIFGVLQRVGRSFMLPIAILPVAGLLLGIGSSFTNETTIATYGLTAILGNNQGVSGAEAAGMAAVKIAATGKTGDVTVTLADAVLSSYNGPDNEAFTAYVLDNASVTTKVDYSVYDVNQDGTVNQLDITRAQRAYGAVPGDANWNVRADVNKDSVVDINDLILVLNNYSK